MNKKRSGRAASAHLEAARESRDLPHPITFFLSAGQRLDVLRALRRLDPDRARALLILVRAPRSPRNARRRRSKHA
jgi:hypothetical protein